MFHDLFFSGGRVVTITGTYLDSVQEPILHLYSGSSRFSVMVNKESNKCTNWLMYIFHLFHFFEGQLLWFVNSYFDFLKKIELSNMYNFFI